MNAASNKRRSHQTKWTQGGPYNRDHILILYVYKTRAQEHFLKLHMGFLVNLWALMWFKEEHFCVVSFLNCLFHLQLTNLQLLFALPQSTLGKPLFWFPPINSWEGHICIHPNQLLGQPLLRGGRLKRFNPNSSFGRSVFPLRKRNPKRENTNERRLELRQLQSRKTSLENSNAVQRHNG